MVKVRPKILPKGKCPIWDVDCYFWQSKTDPDFFIVRGSPRVAYVSYEISSHAISEIPEWMYDESKARLTTMLIDKWKRDEPRRITVDEIRHAGNARSLPVYQRADRLLEFLARDTLEVGQIWEVFSGPNEAFFDQALAWSESTKRHELHYLADYLKSQGWIATGKEVNPFLDGAFENGLHVWRVEVPGYSRIEELETNPDASKCFVAMWFDESMNEVYEKGIRPAIEEVGYSPSRIDRQEFIGKIDDEIIAEIRRSRFLVADATHGDGGARGGVYYEAGFAHGLGLPVIFTCRNDMIDKVHFDTRQFNHIVWENPDDLREQLSNRIGSVLGDGPNAD